MITKLQILWRTGFCVLSILVKSDESLIWFSQHVQIWSRPKRHVVHVFFGEFLRRYYHPHGWLVIWLMERRNSGLQAITLSSTEKMSCTCHVPCTWTDRQVSDSLGRISLESLTQTIPSWRWSSGRVATVVLCSDSQVISQVCQG